MPAKWQQWMPLYIDRFLGSSDVQMMEPAEFKGYVCLLLAQWQTDDCSLPSDHEELARISRIGTRLWRKHSDRILRKFVIANGRLRNEVCYEEWLKALATFDRNCEVAEELKRKRSEAGKQGNRTRWGDRNLIASESQVRSQGIASGIANESQNIALTGTVTGTVTGTGGTPPLPPPEPPPEPPYDPNAKPEDTIPKQSPLESQPGNLDDSGPYSNPEANVPDGLEVPQYAISLMEFMRMSRRSAYPVYAALIDVLPMLAEDEHCALGEAARRMLTRMRDAERNGPVKWRFWLGEEGGWKQRVEAGVSTEGWQ